MIFSFVDINWLAVALATIVYFLLGGLWFSPFVFGKFWEDAIGFDRPAGWKETKLYYIGPFLGCLSASVAIAILMQALDIHSITEAVILGLLAGLGFSAPVSFVNAITPKMSKPLLYGLVTGTYHLLGIVIASVLIYSI